MQPQEYLNQIMQWASHNPTLAVSLAANLVFALMALAKILTNRRLHWAIETFVEGVGEEQFQQLVAATVQSKDVQIKSLRELIEQQSREAQEAKSNYRAARVERKKFDRAVRTLV